MEQTIDATAEDVDLGHEPEMSRELVASGPPALAVTPHVKATELVERLEVIREAMDSAMKEDVDYGRVPGTDKPTLLKPGAEKLGVLFQLDVQVVNDKAWGPGDHLTVVSHATAFHAPSRTRLGCGEGVCTTKERKYAYRKQERTCPQCGAAAVIKGKAEYGGGWLCWKKRDGCNAKFADGDQAIEAQPVGEIENPDLPDLWNCVTPDTRILTRDLRWVPAGELKTGDVLISVAEENRDRYGRPYEDAVVTVGDRFADDLYELTTEDGRVVRCNGEHQWLVQGVQGGMEWVATSAIFEALVGRRTGRPRGWRILSMGAPWEWENSVEGGYMAGLLDADGSLDVSRTVRPNGEPPYHGVVVSFAQQEGGVLDRFTMGLEGLGFEWSEYPHQNSQMRAPVVKVHVRGGLFEQMRLLGTIRPPRLLDRWAELVDLGRRRFEGKPAQVKAVARVGRGELVRLGTSSRTYVAEGLVCHNTVVKMAQKRARIDVVLAVTGASALFTQDVEDQGSPPSDPAEPPSAQATPDAPQESKPDLITPEQYKALVAAFQASSVHPAQLAEWLDEQKAPAHENLSERITMLDSGLAKRCQKWLEGQREGVNV